MRLLLLFVLCALAPLHSRAQALLRNGDVFDLRLGGMPAEYAAEFAFQYTVGDSGGVRVPLIGEIKAAGRSSTQLADAIERKLKEDRIFTNPTALISLQPQTRFVTVGGAVRSPQAVAWNDGMTLSQSIIRAGGYDEFNRGKKVKLTRDGQPPAFFNLTRLDKDPAQNPKLLPGDEVTVLE